MDRLTSLGKPVKFGLRALPCGIIVGWFTVRLGLQHVDPAGLAGDLGGFDLGGASMLHAHGGVN